MQVMPGLLELCKVLDDRGIPRYELINTAVDHVADVKYISQFCRRIWENQNLSVSSSASPGK